MLKHNKNTTSEGLIPCIKKHLIPHVPYDLDGLRQSSEYTLNWKNELGFPAPFNNERPILST